MTTWHISVGNGVLFFLAVLALLLTATYYVQWCVNKGGRFVFDVETDHPITAALKTLVRVLFWGLLIVTAFWTADLGHAVGFTLFTFAGIRGWVVWACGWAVFEFAMTIILQKWLKKKKKSASKSRPFSDDSVLHDALADLRRGNHNAEQVLRDLERLRQKYGGTIEIHPITEEEDERPPTNWPRLV